MHKCSRCCFLGPSRLSSCHSPSLFRGRNTDRSSSTPSSIPAPSCSMDGTKKHRLVAAELRTSCTWRVCVIVCVHVNNLWESLGSITAFQQTIGQYMAWCRLFVVPDGFAQSQRLTGSCVAALYIIYSNMMSLRDHCSFCRSVWIQT